MKMKLLDFVGGLPSCDMPYIVNGGHVVGRAGGFL